MRDERGLALIMAILIMALAASVAAFAAWQQQLWVRQAENLNDQAQAVAVAKAAMDFGRQVLLDDAKKTGPVDHLGEAWAQGLPALPAEYGQVTGTITDQQGLYNLNNLAIPDANTNTKALQTFQRLLVLLKLPPELANAVADWVDPNVNTPARFPGGGKDLEYLGRTPPYRTAARPLADVNELYRVKGVDEEVMKILRPFVTALPVDAGPTPVNMNTAPAEVIAAVLHLEDLREAQGILDLRNDHYFKTDGDFTERVKGYFDPTKIQDPNPPQPGADYGVLSNYFLIAVASQFGRTRIGYATLVQRTDANSWPRIVSQKQLSN